MSLPSLLPDDHDPPDHSDEIDLRAYVQALLAHARGLVLIMVGTMVVIVGGYAVYTALQPPSSQASTNVGMPLVIAMATVIGLALGGAYAILSVLNQMGDK